MVKRKNVLISLLIGMMFISTIGIIALKKVWSARVASNEASVISTLRTLHTALETYASRYPQTGFPRSLTQLGKKLRPPSCMSAGLLEAVMSRVAFTKSGYDFIYTLTQGSGSCSAAAISLPGLNYAIIADPSVEGRTGIRHFFLDSSGVVRQNLVRKAGPRNDPVPFAPKATTEEPSPLHAPEALLLPDTIILESFLQLQIHGVRFDHKAHAETRMIDCVICHHSPKPERPSTTMYQACTSCHEVVVRTPMKTSMMKAFHDAAGTSGTCIDCHKAENRKGNEAPVQCNDCHTQPSY